MYGLDSTLLFHSSRRNQHNEKPLGSLKFHYIEKKKLMSCMDNHKQYYVFKSCCCSCFLILSSVYSGHATTVTYSFYSIKPPIITFVKLVFLINSHGLKLHPSPVCLNSYQFCRLVYITGCFTLLSFVFLFTK